jgi:hypothetical protein
MIRSELGRADGSGIGGMVQDALGESLPEIQARPVSRVGL